MNYKRFRRLYRLANLQIARRRRRSRAKYVRGTAPFQATQPNEIWTLDFVSDRLLHGRVFRALTLLDENSKYCFAVDPAFSYPSTSVVKALENAAVEQACPKYLRVDNELRERVKGSSTIGRASTSVRGRSAWAPSELPAKSDSLTMVTQGLYEPSMSFKQRVGPSGRSEHYLRGQACLNGTSEGILPLVSPLEGSGDSPFLS
jgi:hypothetical protein